MIVFVALVTVAAAACSDKKSNTAATVTTASTTTTTAPITKAEFVSRANAICTTMNAQVEALPDPGDDKKKQADTVDATSAITRTALDQLRALPVPPADAATITAIWTLIDGLLKDAVELSAALRSGSNSAVQRASGKIDFDTDVANKQSNDYGLTVCGS
jgi:hypothetical protein